jgi:hypothetical protein
MRFHRDYSDYEPVREPGPAAALFSALPGPRKLCKGTRAPFAADEGFLYSAFLRLAEVIFMFPQFPFAFSFLPFLEVRPICRSQPYLQRL